MITFKRISSLLALLTVGACTTMPTGPSVLVMPGTGKSFDQFRADDAVCRQFAFEQIGGATPDQTSVDSGVRSAAVGAVVGAAAGAALGGHGDSAAAGAGMGLLVGSLAGAGAGQSSAYTLQHRYDNAYIQCMYAKGERVPVSGHYMPESVPSAPQAPQGYAAPPPPPPGYAPPPPPPRQ